VAILITEHQVTVIERSTGEVLATHTIDPTRTYWRNEQRERGWLDSRVGADLYTCGAEGVLVHDIVDR
jgi:hypothetical protein